LARSIAISVLVPASAFGGAQVGNDPIIETSHAAIESQQRQRLRVVFAPEGQSAVLFKPAQGSWDWSATDKLVIPVENPGEDPLTFLLRIDSAPNCHCARNSLPCPMSFWAGR
jgi:hypothetical protein